MPLLSDGVAGDRWALGLVAQIPFEKEDFPLSAPQALRGHLVDKISLGMAIAEEMHLAQAHVLFGMVAASTDPVPHPEQL